MAIFHNVVDQAGCPVLYFLKPLYLLQRHISSLPTPSLLVSNACMTGSVAAAVRYRHISMVIHVRLCFSSARQNYPVSKATLHVVLYSPVVYNI